jgi:hypothetical protein
METPVHPFVKQSGELSKAVTVGTLRMVPPEQRGEALGATLGGVGGGVLGGLAGAHWTKQVQHRGARAALIALGILGGMGAGSRIGQVGGSYLPKPPLSEQVRWRLANA